jgi:hypothetical protein
VRLTGGDSGLAFYPTVRLSWMSRLKCMALVLTSTHSTNAQWIAASVHFFDDISRGLQPPKRFVVAGCMIVEKFIIKNKKQLKSRKWNDFW